MKLFKAYETKSQQRCEIATGHVGQIFYQVCIFLNCASNYRLLGTCVISIKKYILTGQIPVPSRHNSHFLIFINILITIYKYESVVFVLVE